MRFVILAEFHFFPLCFCLSDVIFEMEHSDCASRKKNRFVKEKKKKKHKNYMNLETDGFLLSGNCRVMSMEKAY